MTDKTDSRPRRRARRDTIQDVAAPSPAFWVTRDSVAGALADVAQVWSSRPRRLEIDQPDGTVDVRWAGDHREAWSLFRAGQEIRAAVPATDLECVCVGRPGEAGTPSAGVS